MLFWFWVVVFFFSSRRRQTRCAVVTGVQTCALPISSRVKARRATDAAKWRIAGGERLGERARQAQRQRGLRRDLPAGWGGRTGATRAGCGGSGRRRRRQGRQGRGRSDGSRTFGRLLRPRSDGRTVGNRCVSTCSTAWSASL